MIPPSTCQPVSTWAGALSPFLLAGINCPHSTSLPNCMLHHSPQLLKDIPLSHAALLFPSGDKHAIRRNPPRRCVCPHPQPLPRPSALLYKETPEDMSMMCLQLISCPLMNPLQSGWVPPLLPNSSYSGVKALVSWPAAISQTSFTLLSGIRHN